MWIGSSVDPNTPFADMTGVDEYMDGLIQFGQAVLPGTTRVISASAGTSRAVVEVRSRVQCYPDAPELTLRGVRVYRLADSGKIADERVIFFISAE